MPYPNSKAERRKPAHEVTQTYEDRGIFKKDIVQLTVNLVPRIGQNARQGIIIKGYLGANDAIDVVFAGRRTAKAGALVTRLRDLMFMANKMADPPDQKPEPDNVRFPVRIEGAWRPRFSYDDMGWQTRQHQLYAARWMMMDTNGRPVTYGEIPKT